MMRPLKRISKKTVLAGLVLVSVVLTPLPARWSRWIGHTVRPLLAPLGQAGMYLTTHVRSRVDELTAQPAPGEDAELAVFLAAVERHIADQQAKIQQLQQWRSILGEFPCKLIDARVVGVEGLPLRDRRMLDAGSADGVAPGDLATTRRLLHPFQVALPRHLTVLGRNYVVGRIADSGAHTATLELVTDPAFRMPANLWRMVAPGEERVIYVNDPKGGRLPQVYKHDRRPEPYPVGGPIPVLAEGDGRQIVLHQVPVNHGVRRGDLLTSSESTELLPFGLTIGRVSRTRPDKADAHSLSVLVEPLADLGTLRKVYIVLPVDRAAGGE